MHRYLRKGQSTLEYAVIIMVVVAALVAIQIYMKRGVQGKLRESIDKVGEQYSAGRMTSSTTRTRGEMTTYESFGEDGKGKSYYEVKRPTLTTETKTEATADKLEEEDLLPPQ